MSNLVLRYVRGIARVSELDGTPTENSALVQVNGRCTSVKGDRGITLTQCEKLFYLTQVLIPVGSRKLTK
jgi:hypothetical protein